MSELKNSIEAVEAGYEYMLAYAAQGLEANQSGAHEEELRGHLTAMVAALTSLPGEVNAAVSTDTASTFLEAVAADCAHAQGAIQLVLTKQGISSQLIDNLNASSHLRAVLTDLFLIDEALK